MPKTRNQTKESKNNSVKTVDDDQDEVLKDSDSSTDGKTLRTGQGKAKKSIPINNDQPKDLQDEQQEYKSEDVVSDTTGNTEQGLNKDERSITKKETVDLTPKTGNQTKESKKSDDVRQENDNVGNSAEAKELHTQNESTPINEQQEDKSDEQQEDKSEGVVSETSEESKHEDDRSITFRHILLILGIALLAYFLPKVIRSDPSNTDERFNYPKIFNNRVEELKQLFPNQTDRFWRIVKSRGSAHLRNKMPSQPLVILMGAPPSAHSVVDCLAKKIAWSLNPEVKASDFIHLIDGSAYSGGDGDETKEHLDDTLEDIFQHGVRSAVVMHLERLPHPSPLLFYKYCDNDEAPYKHAGILFTVHLPNEPNAALSQVEAEGSVEKFLSEIAWSKFPYESDSILALLSRIADTVVLVSKETEEVVKSVCN